MSSERTPWSRLTEAPMDIQGLLGEIPYAAFLGLKVERKGSEITLTLPFKPALIGNPMLPALHGGIIGSFLETMAIIELLGDQMMDELPKPIDVSIDYLRSGKPVDTYARATITKRGRRVANVRAEAWQDDRTRPIAALHGHFLISPRDTAEKPTSSA